MAGLSAKTFSNRGGDQQARLLALYALLLTANLAAWTWGWL